MKIEILDQEFSICKVHDLSHINTSDDFFFIGKTDEEISLVCPTSSTPSNTLTCDFGWRALRIQGILEFSLVGILSKISQLLSEKQISLFAISTYNTDYILVKNTDFQEAIVSLQKNGYILKNN